MKKAKNTGGGEKKIVNWSEYNASLLERGKPSLFMEFEELKAEWYSKEKRVGKGKSVKYADKAIETMHIVSEAYNLPYRQTEGFLIYMFKANNIELEVPDYTMMSKRGEDLNHRIKIGKEKIRALKERGEKICIAIDSTGVKIYGENEWKVRTHGKGTRRKWKKLHAIIDIHSRQIIAAELTGNDVHDSQVFDKLLKQAMQSVEEVEAFYGDGAYHPHAIIERLEALDIEPMIPLPKNAVIGGESKDECMRVTKARDKLLLRQYDAGGTESWKKATDYHLRSMVENLFSRMKRIFGERMRQKHDNIRILRADIRMSILNMFAAICLPKYAK